MTKDDLCYVFLRVFATCRLSYLSQKLVASWLMDLLRQIRKVVTNISLSLTNAIFLFSRWDPACHCGVMIES